MMVLNEAETLTFSLFLNQAGFSCRSGKLMSQLEKDRVKIIGTISPIDTVFQCTHS